MLHTAAAVLAILGGMAILILPKGTSAHRHLGKIYVISILVMCVLSFFIQEINDGGFSIFHLISVQTLLLVGAGLVFLVLRPSVDHWYVWHLRFMLYSYVTLIVTGIAQAFEYLPFGSDLVNALLFIQLPAVTGWFLIEFRGVRRWRAQLGPSPVHTMTTSR